MTKPKIFILTLSETKDNNPNMVILFNLNFLFIILISNFPFGIAVYFLSINGLFTLLISGEVVETVGDVGQT